MKAIVVWWLLAGGVPWQAYPEDAGGACLMAASQLAALSAISYRCELGVAWVPA